MNKIKTYEQHIINHGVDENGEDKIDQIIQSIIDKKHIISALGDTINYVSKQIEKTLPPQLNEFMQDLNYYDDEMFDCIDHIKEKLIDGYPNLKDMIEEIENEIVLMENYMKLKKK